MVFVTLFNIAKTSRTVAKCHSAFCNTSDEKCRNINTIHTSKTLCAHLKVFRRFYMSHVFAGSETNVDDLEDVELEEIDKETPLLLPDEQVSF